MRPSSRPSRILPFLLQFVSVIASIGLLSGTPLIAQNAGSAKANSSKVNSSKAESPEGKSSFNRQAAIDTLRKIQANDRNMSAAVQASKGLTNLSGEETISILEAMKGATSLGRNWLGSVANSLYAKADKSIEEKLRAFLADSTQDGEARYLVFQWLTRGNDPLREYLLAKMLDDSSLEIRHAAVASAIKKINPDADKVAQLKKILESARHHEQVVSVIELLEKEGQTIDRADQFGFIKGWKVIGPFDNVEQKGFNVVYAVEKDLLELPEPKSEYPGKTATVAWKSATADSKEGQVDLNPIFDKEKGAIVYAYAPFKSAKDLQCELRLGCINANKVWVNGELVLSNEVYHTGSMIDQYVADVALRKGENRIVIKVCQNEQTEQWAQNWAFQLRICDATGKAIASMN